MPAEYKEGELEKYLVQVRRIAEHREVGAEKKIRKIYKDLVEDLNAWLGNYYARYAEDDALNYNILRQKRLYARFLEEVQLKIEGVYPELKSEVENLIDTTYKVCWQGMCDGVAKSERVEDLHKTFKASRAITPEQIKAAVQNPIPKLSLNSVLKRNRRQVIINVRREIGIGLSNGDRMSTMARRISKCVNNDYRKAMLISRTEAHRVREVGFNDSAERLDRIMRENGSEYRMTKTWRNKKDLAVRKTDKANHVDMEGQTVLADEDFTLVQSGAKAKCPGTSGIAAEDCNCRCRASRDIMSDAEFFAATGRHFPGYKEKVFTNREKHDIIDGEKGISGKAKTATKTNTVDIDYINSEEYKAKFKKLPYSSEVNNSIYRQSKAALIHRNKTDHEDMYLIDSRNGKIAGSQTSSSGRFAVEYNSSLNNAIKNAPKKTLISLHNHPTENPPTGSDFASLGYHGYHSGVVVCHNGKVYWYKVGERPFLTSRIDNSVSKYKTYSQMQDKDAIAKVLNEMEAQGEIEWREIK